jgi:hypothetical protein
VQRTQSWGSLASTRGFFARGVGAMSDRVRLPREIAARNKPRFSDINLEPKTQEERLA